MSDDDDKATVVIDITKLREQMGKAVAPEEDIGEVTAIDLEFTVGPDDSPTKTKIKQLPSFDVLCFDFGNDLFSKIQSHFPSHMNVNIIKDIKILNQHLAQRKFQVLFLNYDGSPQAVNQISTQVKAKFPECKTVIVAKSLSLEKAQIHQKSPAGAEAYMSHPLSKEKLSDELEKIYSKFN